jgi:large subunit ribosomal protein L23
MAINIFKKDEKDAAEKKTEGVADSKKTKKTDVAASKGAAKIGINAAAAKVLRGAHITEKAAKLAESNKYVFKVALGANKTEIAKAIESSYKVTVTGVNIVNIPPKNRRRGKGIMVKPGYRKAIVSIKAGQTIEVLPK